MGDDEVFPSFKQFKGEIRGKLVAGKVRPQIPKSAGNYMRNLFDSDWLPIGIMKNEHAGKLIEFIR